MHAANEGAEAGAQDRGPRRRRSVLGRAPRTRSVLLASGFLAVAIAPFGIAATGDPLREGKRNGTTSRETEIVGNLGSTQALKGGYVTRQSNLSSSGGGAVYGCRSQAGGSRATPTPQNPCVRANNLSRGLAFEFNSTIGEVAGAITVGGGGDGKRPFTTNATGVATGLNADEVDGQSASEILAAAAATAAADATTKANAAGAGAKARWALVNESGQIEAQSGGFTKVNCYEANDNCYIDIGEDASNNGLGATISVANTDGSNILSGEIGVAQCFNTTVLCGPAGTDTTNGGNAGVIVVAPRESDGTDFQASPGPDVAGSPSPTQAARFYVTVTG